MPGLPSRPDPDLDAERIDLLRRRVMAVLGHELRTPATTLRGLAQELADCDDDVRRADLTGALKRGTERLEQLVDDLLLANAIETALPVGPPADVDLAEAVVQAWRRRTGDSIDVEGPVVARARAAGVRRALEAIVDNAVSYGEAPFEVRAAVDGDRAVVSVASGGPTLGAADLELSREAFYRGEDAVTRAPGRLGIGLAVARALARADGGDVEVGGRDGGGVVATISLPAG